MYSIRHTGVTGTILALCLAGLNLPRAAAEQYDDVEVIVQPQPTADVSNIPMASGYLEHRILVRNLSKTREHQIELTLPSDDYGVGGDYLSQDSRTIRIAPEATSLVSIFQPAMPMDRDSLAVVIDGRRQKTVLSLGGPFGSRHAYGGGGEATLMVLASRDVPEQIKDRLRTEFDPPNVGYPTGASDRFHESLAMFRSQSPVKEWSPNWLGYTCYDVVLLMDHEVPSLPPDVVTALRRFAETGGTVLIHSANKDKKAEVPLSLRDAGAKPGEHGLYPVGFGMVGPSPMTGAGYNSNLNQNRTWPLNFLNRRNLAQAPKDAEVQVVSNATVPVRGLLLLVTVFAIGIGPVNFWLLWRWQKRMWLWWNIPAVSMATCLAVFGFALFSEGWRGRGRVVLMTLLDENTHNATTLGYVSFYCPLTPSGQHYSYDTEVTPLARFERQDDYGPYGGPRYGYVRDHNGQARSMDWTNDQHLTSGWVAARVPTMFAVRKSETRRERVNVRLGADGTPTVVNSLGTHIDKLVYMTDKGTVYITTDLPAGEERALAAGGAKPLGEASAFSRSGNRPSLRKLSEQPWAAGLKQARNYPESLLTPGRYVAVVRNSPFLETPLTGATYEENWGVVVGISARGDDGR